MTAEFKRRNLKLMAKKFFRRRDVPDGTSQAGAISAGFAVLLLVTSLLGLIAGYKAVQTPTKTTSKAALLTCDQLTQYPNRKCTDTWGSCSTYGSWKYKCMSTSCPYDNSKMVGIPYWCDGALWRNMNQYGECADSCLAPSVPSPTPGGVCSGKPDGTIIKSQFKKECDTARKQCVWVEQYCQGGNLLEKSGRDVGWSCATQADCTGSAPVPTATPGGGTGGLTPCSDNACTNCILNTETSILNHYKDNDWDTSCSNQTNIINNWCGATVNPTRCTQIKNYECKSQCGGGGGTAPPPTNTPIPTQPPGVCGGLGQSCCNPINHQAICQEQDKAACYCFSNLTCLANNQCGSPPPPQTGTGKIIANITINNWPSGQDPGTLNLCPYRTGQDQLSCDPWRLYTQPSQIHSYQDLIPGLYTITLNTPQYNINIKPDQVIAKCPGGNQQVSDSTVECKSINIAAGQTVNVDFIINYPASPPAGTPEWVIFYGTGTKLNDKPIPEGAVVKALDPNGTECGSYTVTSAGSYGVMPCERKSNATWPKNSQITFLINGHIAQTMGPDEPIWTDNGDRTHVELQVFTTPTTTNEWVNIYGLNTTLDGKPIPQGAVITVYDPQNILCGKFIVEIEGRYGVMQVFGDDLSTSIDEGAVSEDYLTFKINGIIAETKDENGNLVKPKWIPSTNPIRIELSATAQATKPSAARGLGGIPANIGRALQAAKQIFTGKESVTVKPTSVSGKVQVSNSTQIPISDTYVILHNDKNDKNGITFIRIDSTNIYSFDGLTPNKYYVVTAWVKTADGNWYKNEPCSFTKGDYDCTVKPGQTKNLSVNIGPQGLRYTLQQSQQASKTIMDKIQSLPVVGTFIQMFITSAF